MGLFLLGQQHRATGGCWSWRPLESWNPAELVGLPSCVLVQKAAAGPVGHGLPWGWAGPSPWALSGHPRAACAGRTGPGLCLPNSPAAAPDATTLPFCGICTWPLLPLCSVSTCVQEPVHRPGCRTLLLPVPQLSLADCCLAFLLSHLFLDFPSSSARGLCKQASPLGWAHSTSWLMVPGLQRTSWRVTATCSILGSTRRATASSCGMDP